MLITKKYNFNRRDFTYDEKCEFCGHETKNNYGYDDNNFYENVIPATICNNCKESTLSKTPNKKYFFELKYPSDKII